MAHIRWIYWLKIRYQRTSHTKQNAIQKQVHMFNTVQRIGLHNQTTPNERIEMRSFDVEG